MRRLKMRWHEGVATNHLQDGKHGHKARTSEPTEPIARKKENVAALLSIYWDNVARNPRGPAPPLRPTLSFIVACTRAGHTE